MSRINKTPLISTRFHLPYNPNLVERARDLRKNPTPAEKKLWYGYLKNFKHRVLRQRPIDNFIVDFYCAQLKLVIEIDGDSHFTTEKMGYDEERTKTLEGYGLRVVRFTNTEVLANFETVCAAIEAIPPAPLDKGFIPPAPLDKGGKTDCNSSTPPFLRGVGGDSSCEVGRDPS